MHLVGGDDSKYEYLAPEDKISALLSGNIVSIAVSESALIHEVSAFPFYCIIFLLKKLFPYLNVQQLVNGLVFSGSFLAFFWMTSILPGISRREYTEFFIIRFIASNAYAMSLFTAITLWSHQLPVFVYLATIPLIFGLLVTSMAQFSLVKCLAAGLVLSLSPSPYASIPWVIPVLICALPFVYVLIYTKPIDALITITVFLLTILLLLFPTMIAMSEYRIYSSGMFDPEATRESIRIFTEVNKNNSLIYPLGLSPNAWLLESLPIYQNSKKIFNFAVYLQSAITIGLALISILATARTKNKIKRNIFAGIILSWILSLILYTGGGVNILFNLLVAGLEGFPFLTMFRNNYDKFAIAIAFFSSIMIFYSLAVQFDKLNRSARTNK